MADLPLPTGVCRYVGGPLDGATVNTATLTRFRDNNGNPITDEAGNAALAGGRSQHYHWTAPGPGRSGLTYVHLTRLNPDGTYQQ